MNRHPLVPTIAVVILLLGAAVLPLAAQGGPDRRPFQFYADLGYINLFSYPKWITVGPEFELRLGRYFSLNPEVTLWIGQSFGRKVKFVPGLTANIRLKRFTLGGGFVYRISEWPENQTTPGAEGSWLMPKAQVGFGMGPARLVFSLLFPGGTNEIAASMTLALGFGRPSRD